MEGNIYMSLSPLKTRLTPMHHQGDGMTGRIEKERESAKEAAVAAKVGSAASKKRKTQKYETVEKRASSRPSDSNTSGQMMQGSGEYALSACSREESLIPIALTIEAGEDIFQKILTFIHKGNQAIFILAASGPVSVAHLRPVGTLYGNVTKHQGCFELLSMAGSVLVDAAGEVQNGALNLTANLARPDGCVFGGAIDGCLIAAAAVQLVVGVIKQAGKKVFH